jgi:Cu2+-exporting ATPase
MRSLSNADLPDAAVDWLESGDTVVMLADSTGCQALFRIGDEMRPESLALIAELKSVGKKIVLLTGDAPAVARRVGAALGIENVRAGMTPQGKHDCVKGCKRKVQ